MTTTATKPKRGRPARTTPIPCKRCGSLGGRIHSKGTTPERLDGTPYGCPGKHCRYCYEHIRKAHLKGKTPSPVLPCARCGDPHGASNSTGKNPRPARYDGAPFGVTGRICKKCFHGLYHKSPFAIQKHRATAAKDKGKPAAKDLALPIPAASPCADCGTREGRVPPGCKTPARHDGSPVWASGVLCTRCYNRAYERKRTAEARALAQEVRDDAEIFRRVRLEKLCGYPLPILDPWFSYEQLTPRAKTRLEIREAKKGGRL